MDYDPDKTLHGVPNPLHQRRARHGPIRRLLDGGPRERGPDLAPVDEAGLLALGSLTGARPVRVGVLGVAAVGVCLGLVVGLGAGAAILLDAGHAADVVLPAALGLIVAALAAVRILYEIAAGIQRITRHTHDTARRLRRLNLIAGGDRFPELPGAPGADTPAQSGGSET